MLGLCDEIEFHQAESAGTPVAAVVCLHGSVVIEFSVGIPDSVRVRRAG